MYIVRVNKQAHMYTYERARKMKTHKIDVLPKAVNLSFFFNGEGVSRRGRERGYNYFMNTVERRYNKHPGSHENCSL